ncbi:MAG: 4Fe-4S dicluster domain-containing protein [Methanobacteriota archaeon]|nr:MAG: 4Fe-4S dicluster domain-containing protein [Euryarchaeota archaeon]
MAAGRRAVPVQGDGRHAVPGRADPGGLADRREHGPEEEGATAAGEERGRVMATPAVVPPPAAPQDPLLEYYRTTRQMNIDLAEKRYKTEFRFRTQQYIRGRGTTAVVDEEVCMGCTHCFDNCAFEAIDMADRKFALPAMAYVSRKAVIIVDNCVGCEKCALVCPVDAIDMIPKEGFEAKDGRMLVIGAPPPAPPKPPVAAAARPAAPAAKPPVPPPPSPPSAPEKPAGSPPPPPPPPPVRAPEATRSAEDILKEIEEARGQMGALKAPPAPKPEEGKDAKKPAPKEKDEEEAEGA